MILSIFSCVTAAGGVGIGSSSLNMRNSLKGVEGWSGTHFWQFLNACTLKYPFGLFFAAPRGVWDLSSPTKDPTHAPCSGTVES